ncbi:MAG: GTP-binding protein [Gammaproteobacteria bacterium]
MKAVKKSESYSFDETPVAIKAVAQPAGSEKEEVNIVIVGHVDHGKSTLIGRLLLETKQISAEQVAATKALCKQQNREFEYAYFLDALEEEQAQNITIDIASIRFTTDQRAFCIIDAPGHREFLKNMISGAASADTAVLIIDVNEGVREQTKRHANMLIHLGINNIVVVLNKMDKINYDQQRYEQVQADILRYLSKLNITVFASLPISAREGELVAQPSQKLSWYRGPTFLELLDLIPVEKSQTLKVLRFPIQDVMRKQGERIYVGTLTSGELRLGDQVRIEPVDRVTQVKQLYRANAKVEHVVVGEAAGVVFSDPIFAERGDVIIAQHDAQKPTTKVVASVFWFHKQALRVSDQLLFKLATAEVKAQVVAIKDRLDSDTLTIAEKNSRQMTAGETAELTFSLETPVFIDEYSHHEQTGRFVLQRDGDIAGGGIVKSVGDQAAVAAAKPLVSTKIESKKRSLFKAVSWRIIGAITTGVIAWGITGTPDFGIKIGLLDFVLKIGIYYVHERLWDRVSFGRQKA